jgi:predicted ester cyclase
MEATPTYVMLAMVRMFATGDVSRCEQLVSPDYVDHQGLHDGPRFGSNGFSEVVAAARDGYEMLHVTVEDLVAGPDRAAARIHWRGERSGEVIERETIDIVRVVSGRAVEHWGGRSR